MNRSSAFLTMLLLGISCSKIKDFEDRTKKMERSTEEVSNTTTVMYQQIRSKEAEDTRDEKFQILMGKKAEMGERITAAGVYFKSFEFQLSVDNNSYDNESVRRALYLDAANEFTRKLNDLYEKIKPKKMSPTNTNNKYEMSFYALAAALHMNHHFHEELARKKGLAPVSFYDILKTTLRKEVSGEHLMEHEEVLMSGINKEMIIELIKARVDILAALGLKNLTDKRDMTLSQKSKAAVFKVTGGRFMEIELPEVYGSSNDATKTYAEKYLDGALKARDFLREIGIEKDLEKTIKSALANIDFDERALSPDEKSNVDEKKDKIRYLINTLMDNNNKKSSASYSYIL